MSNIDLSKFIGASQNILTDLYNEDRESPKALGYQEYLALPKTEEYIKRETEKESQQKYDNYVEKRYDYIINKISNQQ